MRRKVAVSWLLAELGRRELRASRPVRSRALVSAHRAERAILPQIVAQGCLLASVPAPGDPAESESARGTLRVPSLLPILSRVLLSVLFPDLSRALSPAPPRVLLPGPPGAL